MPPNPTLVDGEAFSQSSQELTREQNAHPHNFCESCFDPEATEHDYGPEPASNTRRYRPNYPRRNRNGSRATSKNTEGKMQDEGDHHIRQHEDKEIQEAKQNTKEEEQRNKEILETIERERDWEFKRLKLKPSGGRGEDDEESDHDDYYIIDEKIGSRRYPWNNPAKKPTWCTKEWDEED